MRAERGRGRDRAALVHVAREHRRAALDGRRRCGRGAAAGAPSAVAGVEHVGLRDAPARAAAGHAGEVDALGGGHARGDGRDLRVGRDGGRCGRRRRRRPSGASGSAALAGAAAPACMRAMTWPTVTVSPSSARISVIVPAAGAGSSMSTLSVEISTTVSPSATVSPTLTAHSRIVPSVTDSPPAGVTMSTTSPPVSAGSSASASAARRPRLGRRRHARGRRAVALARAGSRRGPRRRGRCRPRRSGA